MVARQDGGSNAGTNIVAACRFCNGQRHARRSAPEPGAYRALVSNRLRQGKWHPSDLHRLI
ncbi:hypothetical protein [Marinobacterium nitratireducens]|uniref:hypothetical protein n=1 Tax=Marinobacterium nitratireducens TaxID=518897 RepID=UPI0035712724